MNELLLYYNQESEVMGMWEQRIKGVYKNSKHRVGGNQKVWNYYYKEKQGQGLMKPNVGLWSNYGSGCVGMDAHMPQVLGLAENH